MTKYLITSALPYINGIKHLGNLIGSILPADVYARHRRQQGHEVLFICGTDEHGTPAELAAEAAGLDVQTYCSKLYDAQKSIYHSFDISFDYFGRSSDPENHQLTQSVFQALDEQGHIESRHIKQFYSKTDQRFLPDRYVEGTCPHCEYDKARGDQCEACGRLLEPTELKNPYSAVSGSADLEIRETDHLFLKLKELTLPVQHWVEQHDNWPAVTKGIAQKWLTEGLQARCISRDLSWGVPIPKPGFENKVFYVWFDAPIAYISMTQAWAKQQGQPDAWKDWWLADQNTVQYSQFMAKDNIPFHAIFWPAMMIGTQQNWKLADEIKGFNWLTYDGGKFSTSQRRGVFMDAALSLFPTDYWRYYLLANAPENSDADFTFEQFAAVINKDLADILGNFVNRVTALINKYFDGAVPEQPLQLDSSLAEATSTLLNKLETALDEQKFRHASQQLRMLWVLGNEYITKQEPWKLIKADRDAAANCLNHCLQLLRCFAIASSAFIPNTAQKLYDILGLPGKVECIALSEAHDLTALPGKQAIKPHQNLFQKITPETIQSLQVKFAG